MTTEPQKIGRTDLARILGITTKAIDAWPIAPTKKGKTSLYDLTEVLTYLFNRAKDAETRSNERKSVETQRSRLVAAQADKAELVAMKLAGELVGIAEVESVFEEMTFNLSAAIKMLPNNAPRFDGDIKKNRFVLEQVQDEILRNIREWNPDDYTSGIIDEDESDSSSSNGPEPKNHSKRTRGSKKMAKRR